MNDIVRDKAAIVGIGRSQFGRFLSDSQLKLGATALKASLVDSGLERNDIDGLSLHMGWPLGLDYDQIAEAYGLDVRYVTQMWTHGRFIAYTLQHAALAVITGMADVVACVTATGTTIAAEPVAMRYHMLAVWSSEGGTPASPPAGSR